MTRNGGVLAFYCVRVWNQPKDQTLQILPNIQIYYHISHVLSIPAPGRSTSSVLYMYSLQHLYIPQCCFKYHHNPFLCSFHSPKPLSLTLTFFWNYLSARATNHFRSVSPSSDLSLRLTLLRGLRYVIPHYMQHVASQSAVSSKLTPNSCPIYFSVFRDDTRFYSPTYRISRPLQRK